MPGIAGIFDPAGVLQSDIDRMTRLMLHEPFYASGTYVTPDQGVGVGWAGHEGILRCPLPLWNAAGTVCLILTGEVSIDPAGPILVSGVSADPNPHDLLMLYDARGPNFIELLNGRFSGVLIDTRENTAVLFNDRFGLSRVYVHEKAGRLIFGSEAKCLLEMLPETRVLDLAGVADSFACGSALQGRTLFAGVSLLPSAALWTRNPDGSIWKAVYFKPSQWEQQLELPAKEFCDRLEDTYTRILPKYVRANCPVAMSLTGGLDGRMIMACAKVSPGALPTYSFGSAYRNCSDVTLARAIAHICQQPHRTITVGNDFLGAFPELAEKAVFVSDGAMDVTGAVEIYVNRAAREIAPIRLTGNYGSEIVRGNVAFRPSRLYRGMLAPGFADLVSASDAAYQRERRLSQLSFIAFRQLPWHHYARLAVEESQLTVRSPFLDNELVALMFRAPPAILDSVAPSFDIIHGGNPALSRLPTDRGIVRGPASAFGRLRQSLADISIKAEYVFDYGMPPRLATIDRWLRPVRLERQFLGRHKFYHFRVWYRDQLADYVRDVLLDPRALQRTYLDGSELERMVLAHTSGRENWTREIHRALTLELLQRRLIDGR